MERAVSHKDESGIVRHLPPFVEIERNRVGLLNAGEPRRKIGRHDSERANGAINVEPEFFPVRDAGERREVVNGSDIDRTCCPYHEKRRKARASIIHNCSVERIDIDLMVVVRGNDMKRVNAETGQIHGLRNTTVSGGG